MSIDWSILYWIQNNLRGPLLDKIMPIITMLGEIGAFWLLIAVIFLITKKYRKTGILIIVGLAIMLIVFNFGVKNLVARPRPCWLDTTIQLLIKEPHDYSFPSGHSLASFTAATIIYKANKKFGVASLVIASLIAFSRLYLFVHFPSDVLAGIIFGIVLGLLVWHFGMPCLNKTKLFKTSQKEQTVNNE